MNIPRLFEFQPSLDADNKTDYQTTRLNEDQAYIAFSSWWDELIVTGVIPLCALIVFNSRIYLKLRASDKHEYRFVGRRRNNNANGGAAADGTAANVAMQDSRIAAKASPQTRLSIQPGGGGWRKGIFRRAASMEETEMQTTISSVPPTTITTHTHPPLTATDSRSSTCKQSVLASSPPQDCDVVVVVDHRNVANGSDRRKIISFGSVANGRKDSVRKQLRRRSSNEEEDEPLSPATPTLAPATAKPSSSSPLERSPRPPPAHCSAHSYSHSHHQQLVQQEEQGSQHFRKRREKSAMILVSIVLTFLVCHTFRLIIQVYEVTHPSHSTSEHHDFCNAQERFHVPVAFYVMLSASHLLLVVNSSINFIIYCCVGKSFRAELQNIGRSWWCGRS